MNQIIATIHSVHVQYEKAIRVRVQAEFEYKLAKSNGYLQAEGAAHMREAQAISESAEQLKAYLIADGMETAMKERLLTLRAELVAAQSLLATQRAEMQMTTSMR